MTMTQQYPQQPPQGPGYGVPQQYPQVNPQQFAYGPQNGGQLPPPKKSHTGWIVAGIVVAFLLGLGAINGLAAAVRGVDPVVAAPTPSASSSKPVETPAAPVDEPSEPAEPETTEPEPEPEPEMPYDGNTLTYSDVVTYLETQGFVVVPSKSNGGCVEGGGAASEHGTVGFIVANCFEDDDEERIDAAIERAKEIKNSPPLKYAVRGENWVLYFTTKALARDFHEDQEGVSKVIKL